MVTARSLFFDAREEKVFPALLLARQIVGGGAALAVFSFLFFAVFYALDYNWNWTSLVDYRLLFFQGWIITILISVLSLAVSLLAGLILALAQRAAFLPLRYGAWMYVQVIRGAPLLVQILVFFYVFGTVMHIPYRYALGVLILSQFAAAYISEIIRAGIESVGKTQLDSAKAMGFTRWQTYRFVIFPQALRQSLPPLAGQLVSLIKDSSLLSVIAINELTMSARDAASLTYSPLECYLPLAAGYLILTLPLSLMTQWIEKRMHYET